MTDEEQEVRFSTVTRGETVAVRFGPRERPFFIHKTLLTSHSDFFQKAFSGTWTEAADRSVNLVDVEVATFNAFVEWLYTQRIPISYLSWHKSSRVKHTGLNGEKLGYLYDYAQVACYVFADEYFVPAWKRTILHEMIDWVGNGGFMFYETIIYAYENLPPNDPLLELIVDAQCRNWRPIDDSEAEVALRESIPQDFLTRAMVKYSEHQGDQKREELYYCTYHDHKSKYEEEECIEAGLSTRGWKNSEDSENSEGSDMLYP